MTPARTARTAAAAALAALSLLPIANWIPGGHETSQYGEIVGEWWSGGLIVVGVGVLLALASRAAPALWREGAWARLAARLDLLRPSRSALVVAAAVALYAIVARLVFSGRPLLIDEIDQVWHARVLATGHLWVPTPGPADLYSVLNVVDHAGRRFSQFPIGGPAMLALGSLIHAEWLVGPVFAGFGLWCWSVLLRRTGEAPVAATNALLLLAFAPFALFMSGSHMNHVTTLAWVLAGMAGLAITTADDAPHPVAALGLGLAFGIAGTIRPLDALAFGAPAGLWLFARALRDRRRVRECVLAAVGMAIPLGLLLWANAATTGRPLLFGYTLLWGPPHALGFHDVPFGPAHTPVRGIELISLYLLHLQVRLFEVSFPALLPALGVLALGPRFRPFDRYLMTTAALLLGCYWAYWHNGFYLGPRFVYLLLPVVVLLTARFGGVVRGDGARTPLASRVWAFSVIVGIVLAVAINVPLRAKQYRNAFLTPRAPLGELAQAAGATDALVLVRESWGSQLSERMLGLGVPSSGAEYVYWRTDMCVLETAIDSLERAGVRDSAAVQALRALSRDSARVVASVLSLDHSEHVLPGSPYSPLCLQRLDDDRRGFTVYPPVLLDDRSGSVYIHDQHARDTLALRRYPTRRIFVLTPPDTIAGTPPAFYPASRDSLLRSWGLPAGWGR